jgi:hypothetical protein
MGQAAAIYPSSSLVDFLQAVPFLKSLLICFIAQAQYVFFTPPISF